MQIPNWVANEKEWLGYCRQIVAAADDYLGGRIGLIECSRVLSKLSFKVHGEWDEDFVTFRGIDSETDDVPVGEVRELWDEIALERKERSVAVYLDSVSKIALTSASNLKAKYGT